MSKIKNISIIAVFVIVIFGFAAAHLLLPDKELSESERRRLEQSPDISAEGVFSGEYMKKLESYLLDQFPLRDDFRTVNSALRLYAFRQSDSNGLWIKDGGIYKTEAETNENQIAYAAKRINYVSDKYLDGMNVYYSIIPDKNWFSAEENGYPALDYEALLSIMHDTVSGAEYIDIFTALDIDDYYRTDPHWRQDRLGGVTDALASSMGFDAPSLDSFEAAELYPFYGTYMAQAALPAAPDAITYLKSSAVENAVVTGAEFEGEIPVYTLDKFEGMDGYDIFLSGAQAVLTINSPEASSDRELILFRDSFGSSLAPLLLECYSKITLVDLRYIAADFLSNFVKFSPGADVLFLYSTSLLNSGMLLK